jgi:Amt family ammonium transporter
MTVARPHPNRPAARSLQQASLSDAPRLLLSRIRGLSSKRTLTWLTCIPIALLGLGLFNLSAHAAQLPELTPAFLANNMFVLICAALVIFMNAGFAMVEAGLCRQKNAVNILAKNLIVFCLAATAYWFIGYKIMYNASWVIPGWFKFGGLFFDPTVTPEMVAGGKLVMEPLTYIRGRSIPHQFMIVDEAQNLSPHEVKTIVSRVGEGTKIVLAGDIGQIDNPYLDAASNGLSHLIERMKGQRIAGHVTMSKTERSELASLAADML